MLMMIGYGLGRTKLFPEGSSQVLIAFVWYIAIPCLLFRSLASKALPDGDDLILVAGYYSALYIVYFMAVLIAKFAFKQTMSERGIFGLSTCYANGAFVGVPIIGGAYGDEGVRILLVLLSFHTLTLIPVTTFIVERGRGAGNGILKRTFMSVRGNPILIALLLGLTWSALQIPIPEWFNQLLSMPADAAAPVGLFAAGMALSKVRISGDLAQSGTSTFLKLLLLPITVFVVTKYGLNLPPVVVGSTTLMGALPTGMIAYSFAEKQGIASRRAASTVLLTTGFSALTLSMLLYIIPIFTTS